MTIIALLLHVILQWSSIRKTLSVSFHSHNSPHSPLISWLVDVWGNPIRLFHDLNQPIKSFLSNLLNLLSAVISVIQCDAPPSHTPPVSVSRALVEPSSVHSSDLIHIRNIFYIPSSTTSVQTRGCFLYYETTPAFQPWWHHKGSNCLWLTSLITRGDKMCS